MAFEGYLIRNKNIILNNNLLAEEGYKSNPDQQTDKDSYTDANGMLHRNLFSHLRTKLWINTLELTEVDKTNIMKVFPSRKRVTLTYWNDEREDYVDGIFYIPDIDWVIRRIDKLTKKRTYAPITLTLIEY